jgi:hypothetical protein
MQQGKDYNYKDESGDVISPLPFKFTIGEFDFFLLDKDNEYTLRHHEKFKEFYVDTDKPYNFISLIYRRGKDNWKFKKREFEDRIKIIKSAPLQSWGFTFVQLLNYFTIESKRFPHVLREKGDTRSVPIKDLEEEGYIASITEKPPHEYFQLLDLVSDHNPLKHEKYLDIPLIWLYASAEFKMLEMENNIKNVPQLRF